MLTENRFAVKGTEIWVYDIKVGDGYRKTVLTENESIVYCDIGLSAAVMSGKKSKSFEFQRKSPPFYKSKFASYDFSACGFREFSAELNDSRILIRSGMGFDVIPERRIRRIQEHRGVP